MSRVRSPGRTASTMPLFGIFAVTVRRMAGRRRIPVWRRGGFGRPLWMMLLNPVRVMLVPPFARPPLMLLVVRTVALVWRIITGPLRVLLIPVRVMLGDPVRIVLMPPVGVAPLTVVVE